MNESEKLPGETWEEYFERLDQLKRLAETLTGLAVAQYKKDSQKFVPISPLKKGKK